jgi:hypothetical protein
MIRGAAQPGVAVGRTRRSLHSLSHPPLNASIVRRMHVVVLRRILVSVLFSVCLSGGVYLGLYSCGGVMWHRDLIAGAGLVLVVAACVWPADFWRPWRRRLLLPLAMFLVFSVARGAAATFYAPPPTWSQALREFAVNVWVGPC